MLAQLHQRPALSQSQSGEKAQPSNRIPTNRSKPPKPPPKPVSTSVKTESTNDLVVNLMSYVPVYVQESALLSCSSSISEKLNESSPCSSATSTLTKNFIEKTIEIEEENNNPEIVCENIERILISKETIVDDDDDGLEEIVDDPNEQHVDLPPQQPNILDMPDASFKVPSDQSELEDDDEEEDDDKTFEYTDDDLDEALEDLPVDPVTPTNSTATFSTSDYVNENPYMLMTPRKSNLSQSESNIYLQSTMHEKDDSTYVEMTTMGLATSVLADDYSSNYELVSFGSTAGGALSKSHHKRTESEPVYMELSQFKHSPANKHVEKLDKFQHNSGKGTIRKSALKSKIVEIKKRTKKGHNLPDIVKPSQNVDSDSSDADDESTFTKKQPRSRFSLSDTFRPASYYLGASRPLTECPDSSDSEIVSPPPIPSTPPPLEELKTEEIFSSENYDTVKRRSVEKPGLTLSYDQLPKIHSSSSSLNSIKKDAALKTSRLSLPDHFAKHQKLQIKPDEDTDYGFITNPARNSESSYSYHTDNSSIASSDYDLYNKVKLQSPSFHSAHHPSGSTAEPDSESIEFRSRSESLSYEQQMKRRPLSEDSLSEIESMGDRFEQSIDHADLDVYLNKLQNSDLYLYQNTDPSWINDTSKIIVSHPIIKPPDVFRGDNDAYYGNINFHNDNKEVLDVQFLVGETVNIETRPDSALSTTNGTYYDSLEEKHIVVPAPATFSPSTLKEKNLSIHDAQCESADRVSFGKGTVSAHSRTNSNLSDSVPYYYADLSKGSVSLNTNEMIPVIGDCSTPKLNNQRDVGSLKRNKGISHIQNPITKQNLVGAMELQNESKERMIESKSLFGSAEKNASKEVVSGYASNKLYGIKPTNLNSSEFRRDQMNDSVGELQWEEDAIWRESLRRVSHRHARSLDALDRLDVSEKIVTPDQPVGRLSNEGRFGPLPPLPTEELTTQTLRRKKPRRSEPPLALVRLPPDEHDVYVQLAAQSDVYERLKEGNIPNSRKSIEINRDLIRQWDSMSSGLMKSGPGGQGGRPSIGGGINNVVCAAFGGKMVDSGSNSGLGGERKGSGVGGNASSGVGVVSGAAVSSAGDHQTSGSRTSSKLATKPTSSVNPYHVV